MASRNRRHGRRGRNAGGQQRVAVGTLECPVCYEEYDQENRSPMVFPCGHTLCKRCLISLPREAGNIVLCTTCRESFYFSRIPKNFALHEAMDLLRAQAAQPHNNRARNAANLRVDEELLKDLMERVRISVMQGVQTLEETKRASQKLEALGRTMNNVQYLKSEVETRMFSLVTELSEAIKEFNSIDAQKMCIFFFKYVLYPFILYFIHKFFLKEEHVCVERVVVQTSNAESALSFLVLAGIGKLIYSIMF